MKRLSSKVEWVLFAFSIVALLALGVALDRVTTQFSTSANWVSHTHEVETEILQVRNDLTLAEAGRFAFLLWDDKKRLEQYSAAAQALPDDLDKLRKLTSDNESQQRRIDAIVELANQKLGLMQQSIQLHQIGNPDRQQQREVARVCGELTTKASVVLTQMRDEEENLLRDREVVSAGKYQRIKAVLAAAFAVVVMLLIAIIRNMMSEIRERERAEDAVRRLSSRILDVQDAERRRVARELHDSIGQYFSALMMNLNVLGASESNLDPKRGRIFAECREIAQQGLNETRTISHLLHPPLLDEAGFRSAAQWYVDGFTERSKIQVTLNMPDDMVRMPHEIELVLFRVLQEGLTNIHKHSGSGSALVNLQMKPGEVMLVIEDYGKGISSQLLDEFERTSTGTGIGLAGMRERIRELHGGFNIQSKGEGVRVECTLPLQVSANSVRGDSNRQTNSPDWGLKPQQPKRDAGPDGYLLATV